MKSWKANYTALLIAETMAIMGFGFSLPIIPLFLEEDLGITDPVKLKAWAGIIQSSSAVAMAFFAPIWGHLADSFSRRAMILRAMFGGAVTISLMALVATPWQFLVLRCIQGCLTGTVAAATVLTAGITPAAHVAFALGLLQTGIAVGNSLGPLMGGFLSDLLGYRAAFFCTGLILALAGVIVIKWVDADTQPRPTVKKRLSLLPDIKPIASSPLLITLMLVTFGVHTANTVATPMLPLFLKTMILDAGGDSARVASSTGIVLGVGAVFTALAAVLVGKFSTRAGYWTTLVFCVSAGAILTFPQTFVTNIQQLTILRAASLFFIGGTAPVINAIIAVSTEKNRQGTIYGLNSSVTFAGAALGPMIGAAVAMLNFRILFTTSALILGLSVLAIIKRRK